jgi:hypothetical protein
MPVGKHNSPSGQPDVPGNVTDDQWTRVLEHMAIAPNGEALIRNALRNEENAKSN